MHSTICMRRIGIKVFFSGLEFMTRLYIYIYIYSIIKLCKIFMRLFILDLLFHIIISILIIFNN